VAPPRTKASQPPKINLRSWVAGRSSVFGAGGFKADRSIDVFLTGLASVFDRFPVVMTNRKNRCYRRTPQSADNKGPDLSNPAR
jgi:hypothetical protein